MEKSVLLVTKYMNELAVENCLMIFCNYLYSEHSNPAFLNLLAFNIIRKRN